MRVLILLGIALGVAAQFAAGASPKDACGLLTRSEVTTAIGEPLKTVKGGTSSTGALYCTYTGNDTHLLVRGIALVAASDYVAQRYKSYLSLMKPAKPVSGIGAAAVSDGTAVLARNAHAMVEVAPQFKGAGVTLSAVELLAKKALARA
jgi:hypothetical protein